MIIRYARVSTTDQNLDAQTDALTVAGAKRLFCERVSRAKTERPEFASEATQTWLERVGVKPIRIYPGSPWENGYNERFNGTLRCEVLNAEWFTTTKQAQIVINGWLKQYNHVRPHQVLNMRPPVPEALIRNGPYQGGWTLEPILLLELLDELRGCFGGFPDLKDPPLQTHCRTGCRPVF